MPRLVAHPLPLGCPWSGWTPPNVDWCEAERCAWIVNPADAWSNLGYVVLGVWMIVLARRAPHAAGSPLLSTFGPASVAVGVFSGVYHASYTYFLQFFDFLGMFLFCFTVITANALRLGWIGPGRRWRFFGAGVALFSAAVPLVSLTRIPIQTLIVVLVVAILGQELTIHRRRPKDLRPPDYRLFALALALVGAGAACSLADLTRTWCEPGSWLQGHALWHLLSAAALLALFHFYARIPLGPVAAQRASGSTRTG